MNGKRWIKTFFIILITFGLIPSCTCYLYLKSIYEHNNFDEIVERQIKNESLYGTAFNHNTFRYKLSLIKSIKPDVVALGSSRVMQFREESFNVSFVNAGGAMNYLNEGILFFDEMLKIHKPKFIILGLDFWWFNERFKQPNSFPYHSNDGETMDFTKFIRLYKYLLEGKIDISSFIYIINNSVINNKYNNYDSLGLSAINTSDGFRKDGSRLYHKTIFGLEQSKDVLFENTLDRIKNGNKRFQYGDHISNTRVKLLIQLIKRINKNKIKLIIVVPPVANPVYKRIKEYGKKYAYIDELIGFIAEINSPTYNYHNMSVITNNDCEYIDGFHGGDIIYKRILLDIFNSQKDLYFNSMLNIDLIKRKISKYKGKVLSIYQDDNFSLNEVDFLHIGCRK